MFRRSRDADRQTWGQVVEAPRAGETPGCSNATVPTSTARATAATHSCSDDVDVKLAQDLMHPLDLPIRLCTKGYETGSTTIP